MTDAAASPVPFVGLRPFDTPDQRWFFGRGRETTALTRQMRASRFTAVVGPSGSGKSSIVRAGVVPRLAADGWLPIVTKPGSAPLARLAGALALAAGEDVLAEAHRFRIHATLRASAFGLAQIAATLREDVPHLLLVVDQFEELFRFGEEATGAARAAMREEARAFVELLLAATRGGGKRGDAPPGESGRLHVCVTMRSDFFGSCSAYVGLAEAVSASQFLVPLPQRGQLDETIRKPVSRAGAVIEEALVQRLLVDVEDEPDQLPLLQHTLRRLWEQATGEPRMMREDDYVKVGRIAGSIDMKAEDVVTNLAKPDLMTLERVMKALTDLDQRNRATRRPQKRGELLALYAPRAGTKADLAATESLDRVLAALQAEDTSFLQIGDGEDPDVDIGHEALIRSWKRLSGPQRDFTAGWLREEREDGDRWRDYVRRAGENALLSVPSLQRLSGWLARTGAGESWSQRYGNRWAEVQALMQRSSRSIKHTLAGTGVVLALVIAAVAILWQWEDRRRSAADEAARVASANADLALLEALHSARLGSLALASEARRVADGGDARMAALLARAALPVRPDRADEHYVDEAESALDDALARPIETLRLVGHQAAVSSVAFSPDGKHIVSASDDKTLRLWDAATGQPIGQPLAGHTEPVASVAFSPDGTRIASGSDDGTLRLWDAATGKPIGQPLQGHDLGVLELAFAPDGKHIVSASKDQTLRIWDAATGKPVGVPLRGHTDWVNGVAWSRDGTRIVSAGADTALRLWDAVTGKQIGAPLEGHTQSVLDCAFSPDGKRIVSASADKTLRLWDAATGKQIGQPLLGHQRAVLAVAWSPNGRRIVSVSDDNLMRLWDGETSEPIGPPLQGHSGSVNSVAFSPDGSRIVTGSADATLRVWEVGPGQPIGPLLRGHKGPVNDAVFSPDGSRIASAGDDKTVRLWDASTGKPVGMPFEGHTDTVLGVAFSPDGKRIVSGSVDKTLRLWDAATGQPIGEPLRGHTEGVIAVAFSPDGTRIVSGSDDSTLRLWDAATGAPIGQKLTGHTGPIYDAEFSPDGSRIVSASGDHTLRLWDAATGQPIGKPLEGHTDEVGGGAFSPDGKLIVSASEDRTLRLWNAKTGEPIGPPLRGHAGPVRFATFSRDGRLVVSASFDSTLRLWDVRTGLQVGPPLQGHSDNVFSVAVSNHGRRLVSASNDGTISIWSAPALPELADAVAKADRLCPADEAERAAHGLFDRRFPEPPKPWTDDEKRACGMSP